MHAVSPESVEVLAAPPALRGLFACAVLRRLDVAAPSEALAAWVHANPYACLNVVTAGRVTLGARALPACFLAGPMSAPVRTLATAGLRSVSLVFQPWLLEPLFRIEPLAVTDRIMHGEELRHPLLARWCALAASLDREPVASTAFWEAVGTGLPQFASPIASLEVDVLRSDGVAAAAARAGCSTRQYHRRFRQAMGLAPSAWLRVTRWEDAVREMAVAEPRAASFGELAAGAGYADQAHMTRETRSLAAESPARLRTALRRGEASWSLRPAHGRSVQDKE